MNRTIAVTGTKGKTTVVRLLDFVFRQLGDDVLRVDTSGAYLNDERKVSDEESRRLWGFASTNAPGRFLYLLNSDKSSTAILECTLFCANEGVGLGYKHHNVGIFTNVFDDHLGSKDDLRTRDDIARKKSLIFKQIAPGGTALYNVDDPYVTEQLSVVPEGIDITTIGITLSEAPAKGVYCRVSHEDIAIVQNGVVITSHVLSAFSWLAVGHEPSRYSLGFVYAALFASLSETDFQKAVEALKTYHYDQDGGRMVEIVTKGPKIILDFAHEKYSLKALAEYAKSLTEDSGRVIGVVRLAPSRTDELIDDTAEFIATAFDSFVVYDKVDGHWRKPGLVKGYVDRYEEVGRIANRFAAALHGAGVNAVVRIREDEAIKEAIATATPADVIVYIVNDDSKRSRQFLDDALRQKGWS